MGRGAAGEDQHLASSRREQTDNVARGVVKEIAYMGDMSVYLVQLDSGKIDARDAAERVPPRRRSITWDQPVYLHWHASSPVVLTE